MISSQTEKKAKSFVREESHLMALEKKNGTDLARFNEARQV